MGGRAQEMPDPGAESYASMRADGCVCERGKDVRRSGSAAWWPAVLVHCHDGIAASLTHIPCLQTAQEDKQVPHQKGHKDVAAHIAAHALLSQVTGPARRPAASIKQDRKKAPLRRRRRVIRRAEPSRAPQSPGQAAGNGRLRPQYHPAIPSARRAYAPMGSILTNFECSYIIIL